MKNKFIVGFCFFLYSFVSQAAIEAYPAIIDKFGSKIIFESPISEEDSIKVFQIKNESKKLIFEVPFLAQRPEIAFAFFEELENKENYLILSQKIQPTYNKTGIPYVGDYFLNYVFRLNNGIYEFDKDISNFLGDGGDVYDIKYIENGSSSGPKVIYIYPYQSELSIRNELNSSLFKDWKEKKITKGIVIRKTLLQDVPNYVQSEKRYLINNDHFELNSISGGWLNITYKNMKNKKFTGWILCEDTSICSSK
ncbi:hypothetical protein HYE54_11015 [Aggregatibacter actinomycetemcomitans]|uniref:hypothetical protein n=1 Tax=Aggregatibacter actinomycetemcomitans TaxID=714 RepID=UPI00197C3CF3|nr:hypothetical protein [Aggregatibacter actinomycetemcomitans]MBN6069237.1 hypothetical protein [Aggregatibacter actinomycetemcomitans]MBN6086929.1 hypothetical protein [Aggregatibacter actinomycetemcomitans]